jgi:hypothetical protein
MSGADGGKLEVENKYAVGPGFVVPDLSGLPGVAAVSSPHTYHLTAIYLDTPGFRLASAHITLRRRTGGTDAGWHLKLPAGTARREVHAPLGTGPVTSDTRPASRCARSPGCRRPAPCAASSMPRARSSRRWPTTR